MKPMLVEFGAMSREPYREPGARSRFAYRLTPAGRELQVVLSALQQWGDEHLPRPEGPTMLRRVRGTDGPVRVGYLDEQGREVPLADVTVIPAGSLNSIYGALMLLPRHRWSSDAVTGGQAG